MKIKTPSILIIIGLILGMIEAIISSLDLVNIKETLSSITYVNPDIMPNFDLFVKIGIFLSYVSTVVGAIICIIMLIYLLRTIKKPNKRDYKVMIIISIVGILTSSIFGSILFLIGSIIGFKKSK